MTESLRTLSSDELTPIIYRRLNENPHSNYSFILDFWFWGLKLNQKLTETEGVTVEEVKDRIDHLLLNGQRVAYWSGGFDLGFHCNAITNLKYHLPSDVKVLAGIEPDSYIQSKGRKAQFTQTERLSAVGLLLKQENRLGLVFPVPEKNGQEAGPFYDELIKNIGVYQRSGCYHLYSEGDPYKQIKIARMSDPQPWCQLQLMLNTEGKPFSTTEILEMDHNKESPDCARDDK